MRKAIHVLVLLVLFSLVLSFNVRRAFYFPLRESAFYDIQIEPESTNITIPFDIHLLWPPHASFIYTPIEPVINDTITFDASASHFKGSIVSYEWVFDDGTTSTETEPITSHSYTEAGMYNVTLTVTDLVGLNDTVLKTIYVGQDQQ